MQTLSAPAHRAGPAPSAAPSSAGCRKFHLAQPLPQRPQHLHQLNRQRHHVISHVTVDSMAMSGSYNADINSSVWERRPVPVIARLIEIVVEFAGWQLRYPDDPAPRGDAPSPAAPSTRKAKRAAALRELLVRLGPAFVKIGQALSSRPDILPPDYIVELELLQDRIPSFDTSQAFQVIEADLGAPLPTVFRQISPQPVAAASLGQVYRAVLARDGMEVAVKVQRPGVAEAIALDVFILRWLAAAFRKWRKLNTDLPALVDEWATSLFRELDYRQEARNAARFRELYSQLEGVYVPAVFQELTTPKVLMMEWVNGERLRTAADNLTGVGAAAAGRRQRTPPAPAPAASRMSPSPAAENEGRVPFNEDLALVEVGVRCSLEQMLEHGFYHADPHPGNLLRTTDGRLAYLDFGMCGELDRKTRQALIRATLHLVNREYTYLAQDFIDLGLLPPGSDKDKIVPALTGVFQKALSRGVSNVSFGDLSGELGRTMYQFSFRIPSYYTLLVRSLSVLEGIALASNPKYKVLGSAYPWIARRLLTNDEPELRATLRALLYTPAGAFRFSRLESLLKEATRTPHPLPTALAAASTSNSSSEGEGKALSLLLSPEADFVRDILLDELSKGIDAGWRITVDSAVNSALHPLPVLARVPILGPLLVPLATPLLTTSPPWWQSRDDASSGIPAASGGKSSQVVLSALNSSSSSTVAQEPHLAGIAGDLLAALPHLSSQEDREQLEGLRTLAVALADLAVSRTGSDGSSKPPSSLANLLPGGGTGPGGPAPEVVSLLEAITLPAQLQQAAMALSWLVSELVLLPDSHKEAALKLPAELATRVASRVTARAIRGVMGATRPAAAEED